MLRIIKHIQNNNNKIITESSPSINGWSISYNFSNNKDEIGTIICYHFKWRKLQLPKNPKLRTPKILLKWFQKILNKKKGVQGELFEYFNNNVHFKIMKTIKSIKNNAFNSYIFPLFNNSIKDLEYIDKCNFIPESLKFEIRLRMKQQYTS